MPHLTTKIGEYAIIINEKNEFLMLQFPGGKWHFPGGRLDEGEEAMQGLIREIKEETNLDITDTKKLKPIFTKIFTDEKKYCVFFLTKILPPYEVKNNSDEHEQFKWFKKEDIPNINFWHPFYKDLLEEHIK